MVASRSRWGDEATYANVKTPKVSAAKISAEKRKLEERPRQLSSTGQAGETPSPRGTEDQPPKAQILKSSAEIPFRANGDLAWPRSSDGSSQRSNPDTSSKKKQSEITSDADDAPEAPKAQRKAKRRLLPHGRFGRTSPRQRINQLNRIY